MRKYIFNIVQCLEIFKDHDVNVLAKSMDEAETKVRHNYEGIIYLELI